MLVTPWVCGDQTYKLHHVPSGILHPGVQNYITPGVVIEPNTMLKELEGLEARGIDPRRNLQISETSPHGHAMALARRPSYESFGRFKARISGRPCAALGHVIATKLVETSRSG